MATLNVLAPLTASQGLSGSTAAFASLTVNGVTVTGGGGDSGTVNTGSQYNLAYYPSTDSVVDDATGLTWNGSTFAVSGSTETSGALTVGGSGLLTANNGATINGNTLTANAGLAVNNSSLLVSNGGISGSSTLEVGGTTTLANDLTVLQGGVYVDNGTISGSSTLQVGGDSTLAGNLTVQGNMTVNGTASFVNTTDLLITDKKVVIASGSTSAALASTAGLYVGNDTSAIANFQYVSSSSGAHKWSSSENLNLSSSKAYYLNDNLAVGRTVFAPDQTDASVLQNSSNDGVTSEGRIVTGKVGVTVASQLGISAFTGVGMSGSSGVYAVGPVIVLSGSTSTTVSNALTVQGATTLAAATATTVSASVGVSGALGNFATLNVQGSAVATIAGIQSVYNGVRHTVSGTLNGSGYAELDLTSVSAVGFATANRHKIAVDVMVDDGTGLAYTNDLASVKLEESGSAVWVKVDAPATPNRGYRIVAVNEDDLTF